MQEHKAIGLDLDLFLIFENTAGSVTWLPKGIKMLEILKNLVGKVLDRYGYECIETPQLVSNTLWRKTQHFQKFSDDMLRIEEQDKSLKPMSCPLHAHVYKLQTQGNTSVVKKYREFGRCFRNENSGSLNGLFRLINFTQDDAHIFFNKIEYVESFFLDFVKMVEEVYSQLGFKSVKAHVSLSPTEQQEIQEANKLLLGIFNAFNSNFVEKIDATNDGAFYGPKIDIMVQDRSDRLWQCGTFQLDLVTYDRMFQKQCFMIHHAIFGACERFLAIVLEHNQCVPSCINPRQFCFIPVIEEFEQFVQIEIVNKMQALGHLVDVDSSSKSVTDRVKRARKLQYERIIVFGQKEKESGVLEINTPKGNFQQTIESLLSVNL